MCSSKYLNHKHSGCRNLNRDVAGKKVPPTKHDKQYRVHVSRWVGWVADIATDGQSGAGVFVHLHRERGHIKSVALGSGQVWVSGAIEITAIAVHCFHPGPM